MDRDKDNLNDEIELDESSLRELQKNEKLASNETYEIDDDLSSDISKPPPITEEKIPNEKPETEEIFDDVTKAYFLTEEEEVQLKENIIENKDRTKTSYKEEDGSKTDLSDNVAKEKEYLSKDDVIYNEPTKSFLPEIKIKKETKVQKPAKQPVKQTPIKEEKKVSFMTVMTVLAICITIIIALLFFFKFPLFNRGLSEKEYKEIQESINFFIHNEEVITSFNELSDKKKVSIETYIANAFSKDELLEKIRTIMEEEEKLLEEYSKIELLKTSNKNIKDTCIDFFNSNIKLSSEIINLINQDKSKQALIGIYNNYTEKHNSMIEIYNQYVKNEALELNIPVTVNSNVITIDVSNIKNYNKKEDTTF